VENFDLEDAVWSLRTWPLSQIQWPVQNSERLDITWDPDASRFKQKQILQLLPWEENSMYVWNGDPFVVDGGDGHGEAAPSAWLLPYWMGRYFQFIV